MREALASIAALLVGVGLLLAGTGLFSTFIGLRTAMEGFPKEATGLMMSAFYAGMMFGTLYLGRLINRVGHIRAFAAFCAVCAVVMSSFPFLVSVPAWAFLRAVSGACIAGAYMVVESWLNTRASERTRGTILSLYMMTSFLAMGGSQQLIRLSDTEGLELFMLSAMLVTIALIPVAITRATHPAPVESSRFGLRKLWEISPLAVVSCFSSGLIIGAQFGMSPIFAQDVGMSVAEISTFMTVILASGLLLQLPIGRLSDILDRRKVIIGVGFSSLIVSATMLGAMSLGSYSMMSMAGEVTMLNPGFTPWFLLVAGAFGSVSATLYPLSVAYANDYVETKDAVQASAGLLLAYGVGASVGPVTAAKIMQLNGPQGLYQYLAVVAAFVTLFALYRTRRRSWVPVMEKESFVALPDTIVTPVPMDLDPRTEGTQLELELKGGSAPARAQPMAVSAADREA
jgi:MFS family permease